MAFGQKEASRDRSTPARLFLFRGADPALESMLKSVVMLPGATEFGYGTTRVTQVADQDETPLNYYAGDTGSDFRRSLDDLIAAAPGLRNVTLTVAWHGDDLRADVCTVRPRVASADIASLPYQWRVGNIERSSAQLVSQYQGSPAYDGAPSDRSLFEAIQEIRSRGLRCTIYPILLMDIPPDNGLPDPAGGSEQPAYPWRGRIAVHPSSVEGTADATSQIDLFFGAGVAVADFSWNPATMSVDWSGATATRWKYSKFVLHMATIAAAAGATDFLIGGGLAGLTRVRNDTGAFVAVNRLVTLANHCREILGPTPRISYAAHWTEFHSVQEGGDIIFHLDYLWSSANIDFVGIDNFAPISDWRDGTQHRDWQAGYTSLHDIPYLQSNIEGGEGYDWRYASTAARNNQVRTAITDPDHNEPWIRRPKDFRGWWANAHHNRVGGVRRPNPTGWVPKSKPIVFTSIGCAAVNKGSNRPDVAADYKSSESARPYYSNGRPDAAIMRAFLEAQIRYWQQNNEPGFVDLNSISAYAWDARPYPTFPERTVFQDRANWREDHHLTGRLAPGRAFADSEFGPFAFTDAEYPITRAGITYQPWPIKHDDINSTSSMDKAELNVTMALGSGIEDAFIGFPPSQVINLTIFQGQMDDTPTLVDYPAIWLGRVNAPQWQGNEITFACLPVSSSIRRPGLRRNYQIGCPHVLYGPKCKADRKAASRTATVDSLSRNVVTLASTLANHQGYRGGLAEWTTALGSREVRTIIGTTGTTITLRGSLKGLENGMQITIRFGCDHTLGALGCALHNNFYNYGGQDMIPLDNPLSQKNQFY